MYYAGASWWGDNGRWLANYRPGVNQYPPHDIAAYLNTISNEDFIEIYRLDKVGFRHFEEEIRTDTLISRSTQRGLQPAIQLLVALKYYATGNSVVSLRSTAGLQLSQGSVFNCIKNVSTALSRLTNKYIAYTFDPDNIAAIKHGFFQYGGFPACMGSIDGTQIKIKAPSIDEEIYVGRKTDGHYLNVQVVCDANLRLHDIVVKWPGSVRDLTIWEYSSLCDSMDRYFSSMPSSYKGWLIGDSGYSLRRNMMIPFEDPQTPAEEDYNRAHKKARCSVERAIGVWKSRFRCLCKQSGGAIQFEVEVACSIIAATAVLNNYCRDRNIHQSIDEDVMKYTLEERHNRRSPNPRGDVQDELVHGHSTRQSIVNEYF